MSGGIDSIALAYWMRPSIAITVNYGQVCAHAERRVSVQVCQELGIEHHVTQVDCSTLGSGDLAGKAMDTHAPASDWWPFRNQMLLTVAGMKLLPLGVTELWLGTVKTDQQHTDGSTPFIDIVSRLMQMQEGGIAVKAPAIALTSVELVRRSGIPEDLLAWAHSCHTSDWACGRCRGCNKHREVMEAIGCGNY